MLDSVDYPTQSSQINVLEIESELPQEDSFFDEGLLDHDDSMAH